MNSSYLQLRLTIKSLAAWSQNLAPTDNNFEDNHENISYKNSGDNSPDSHNNFGNASCNSCNNFDNFSCDHRVNFYNTSCSRRINFCKVSEATSIPANLKRRCSQATKMALETTNQALQNNRVDYAIFCAQHGELARSVALMKDISTRTVLSPTNFSQSVHNTAAGLFSVMHNLHADMTSIAADDATFFMGMLEAATWLQAHPNQTVLLVMFDEHIPKEYQTLNIENGDYDDYAVAFLLTGNPTDNSAHNSAINPANNPTDNPATSPPTSQPYPSTPTAPPATRISFTLKQNSADGNSLLNPSSKSNVSCASSAPSVPKVNSAPSPEASSALKVNPDLSTKTTSIPKKSLLLPSGSSLNLRSSLSSNPPLNLPLALDFLKWLLDPAAAATTTLTQQTTRYTCEWEKD